MTDLALLRHFVAVAQTASFTRASEQLHASQSVVSRSIQRLEDQIGASLIERTTRSVTLTPAGRSLLGEAVAILDRLAVATDNARRIGQGGDAEVRIGICASTETAEIVRGIARFRAAWPDIRLKLRVLPSPDQPDALRASRIDVGIMQSGGASFEQLQWQVLTRHRVMVGVPCGWGFAPGSKVELGALRDRPWILPDKAAAPIWHDSIIKFCQLAGFEPRIAAVAEDLTTTRIMVSCGIGACFLHDTGVTELNGAITVLRFDPPEGLPKTMPPAETVVAWPSGSTAIPVGELVGLLAEEARQRTSGAGRNQPRRH